MKNIILTFILCLGYLCTLAKSPNALLSSQSMDGGLNPIALYGEIGDIGEIRNIEDPDFEWTQYKEKDCSAVIGKYGLMIESKKDNGIVGSTTEVSINPEVDSFTFGMMLTGKVAKDKGIGLLFDYANNKNYKCIMFTKDHFVYYTVEGGEKSIVKQGLIKTGKDGLLLPIITRKHGQTIVYLNGQEVTKLKNFKFTEPVFGVAVQGKNKVICSNFIFNILTDNNESETSTTGN
ncbi:MAG: hypothetical protein J1E63_09190 [Muribaculaceae bacterium]|nr:hypothetical protein [Muribaculaceae bacterium]